MFHIINHTVRWILHKTLKNARIPSTFYISFNGRKCRGIAMTVKECQLIDPTSLQANQLLSLSHGKKTRQKAVLCLLPSLFT